MSKVWFITGSSRGFGRELTLAALKAGDAVAATARRPDQLADLVSEYGDGILPLQLDVTDAHAAQAAVTAARNRFGRIDVVVNNAGGSPPVDAADSSPRLVERIVALNLLAPFYVAQAANAVMQKQDDGGVIINIGSVSGVRPSPGTAAYGAAKAGLASMTRTLAVEWAPRVRVNLIVVGMVRTEQSELYYGDDEGVAAVAATVPLGRLAEPADVGQACVWLASPLAAYVTGAELTLHGGGEWPAFLRAAKGDTGT